MLMRADVQQKAAVMRGLCYLMWEAMTDSDLRPWVTFGFIYLFFCEGGI